MGEWFGWLVGWLVGSFRGLGVQGFIVQGFGLSKLRASLAEIWCVMSISKYSGCLGPTNLRLTQIVRWARSDFSYESPGPT